MTRDEIQEVLKAAADKLGEEFAALTDTQIFSPLTAEEIGEYVLRHYTGLNWAYVSDFRAEFKDNGATLAIDLAYAPPAEYLIINLSGGGA
jgi:hypothetical protein